MHSRGLARASADHGRAEDPTRQLNWGSFVGRAAELAILKAATDSCLARNPSINLISGEPGIGKTRLIEEAAAYARARGLQVLRGRCFDTHSAISYFPFVEPFRQYLTGGQAFETPSDWELDAIATLLPQVATVMPKAARVEVSDYSHERSHLFDRICTLLCNTANRNPIVLVLEDLHLADQSSLSLILHLTRRLSGSAILIAGTYTDTAILEQEFLLQTFAELGREPACRHLRLKGLSAAEITELLMGLTGGELDEVAGAAGAEIARITGGNALFIEEYIRQLQETGRLCFHDGRWQIDVRPASHLDCSGNVMEIVDARVSRLSPSCQLVLTHAAVLGDEFDFDIVCETTGFAFSQALAAIEEARCARLIVQREPGAGPEYAFIHDLVRQSLYKKLHLPQRRVLHAMAAHGIEAVHRTNLDGHLASLALHYAKAGPAGDPERAIDYAMRAGDRGFAACAFEEAGFHWEAALKSDREHNINPRRQAALLERLAEVRIVVGASPAEAADYLECALAIYERSGDCNNEARLHARLATLLAVSSPSIDVSHAQSHSRHAKNLLGDGADDAARAEVNVGRAMIAYSAFDTEEGLATAAASMEMARRVGDMEIWCQAAALRGLFLVARGDLKEAFELIEDARQRAERLHSPKVRFATAWAQGFSSYLLMDPGSAQRSFQTGLDEIQTLSGEPRRVLSAHVGFAKACAGELSQAHDIAILTHHSFLEAQVCFFQADWTRAQRLLLQELDRSRQVHSALLEFAASFWLARLHRVNRRFALAEQALRETSVIARTVLRLPEEITARAELALVHVESGKLDSALPHSARCGQIMQGDRDWRGLAGAAARAQAVIAAAAHRFEEAEAHLRRATIILSRYRAPWEQAEGLALCGRYLVGGGERNLGVAKLEEAAQIYRDFGFGTGWVERLDAGTREPAYAQSEHHRHSQQILEHRTDVLTDNQAEEKPDVYSLVTTTDFALLATLTHEAIAHLMNAVHGAAKLREPIDRIANAAEKMAYALTRHVNPVVKRRIMPARGAGRNRHNNRQR